MAIVPRVIDIYHGDQVQGNDCVAGFKKALDFGIWGVIHKASQGTSNKDSAYARRRKAAQQVGLLFGAYHFNTGENVKAQVNWFLKCADPDDETLMVLDFEENARSNMSVHEAVSFMKLVEDHTGRKCAIYSGNRLKETIGQLGRDERDYITSRRLWLCQYGPKPSLPKGYSDVWLWQYTGDGIGPGPKSVPGIIGKVDINSYTGTLDQLKSEWVEKV